MRGSTDGEQPSKYGGLTYVRICHESNRLHPDQRGDYSHSGGGESCVTCPRKVTVSFVEKTAVCLFGVGVNSRLSLVLDLSSRQSDRRTGPDQAWRDCQRIHHRP